MSATTPANGGTEEFYALTNQEDPNRESEAKKAKDSFIQMLTTDPEGVAKWQEMPDAQYALALLEVVRLAPGKFDAHFAPRMALAQSAVNVSYIPQPKVEEYRTLTRNAVENELVSPLTRVSPRAHALRGSTYSPTRELSEPDWQKLITLVGSEDVAKQILIAFEAAMMRLETTVGKPLANIVADANKTRKEARDLLNAHRVADINTTGNS